eukprot:11183266-Lingulodinium_polyedra.AAC.1
MFRALVEHASYWREELEEPAIVAIAKASRPAEHITGGLRHLSQEPKFGDRPMAPEPKRKLRAERQR